MDVSCQQCGVEYEFDDERITSQGVTVKCSSCGHIFKVKREVRVVTEAVAEVETIGGDWMVRQPSGNVFTFKELTTLQRWIVERKVTRGDEISRTGKTWKRLGDIAELASFFQVVDDATGRSFTEVQGMMAVQSPMNPALYGGMQVFGTSPGMAALPATGTASPGSMPPQAAYPSLSPGVTAPLQAAPAPMPVPTVASTPPQAVYGNDDDLLDDEDPVRAWRRRRRWPMALGLLLLVGAGAMVGLRLFARPSFDALAASVRNVFEAPTPVELTTAVATAQEAVLRDTEAELGAAIETCKKAIAVAPARSEPYAALALVETGLAEALDEQFRLAKEQYEALLKRFPEGLTDDQPEKKQATELAAQASRINEEAQAHFKRAADAVTEALTLDRQAELTTQAAADYNRAVGKPDEARRLLGSLPAPVQQQVLASTIGVLADVGEGAPGDRALDALKALVKQHPSAIRVLFRLGLAQERAGDIEAAHGAIGKVAQLAPGHLRARTWLAARAAPPAAPEPVVKPPEPKPPIQAQGDDDEDKGGGSFDGLLRSADRLRDRGKIAQAFALYTKAAGMAPDRAEPRSGMGWCYVEQAKTSAAISSFQSALEVNPSYADAHMGLAESYRARGSNDKALKHYTRYLEILPSGPEAAVAQRWVEELSAK
ncbi:MAG: tetratricopeptide repeat protein [Pseudomonadota bacterium]